MSLHDLHKNLSVKITTLLLIALLPIGLIAIWQTNKAVLVAEAAAETALLNSTISHAKAQAQVFQRAFGAASALGAGAALNSQADCVEIFEDYLASHTQFVAVRYVGVDGTTNCAVHSAAADARLDNHPVTLPSEPRERVFWSSPIGTNAKPYLMLQAPIIAEGALQGYVSLALHPEALAIQYDTGVGVPPTYFLSFNETGQILATGERLDSIMPQLPGNVALEDLAGNQPIVFHDQSISQQNYIYTVVPILSRSIYALAIWDIERITGGANTIRRSALVFPLLMLVISIGVAYFAVHRLVIRHIEELRQKMQRFSKGERNIDLRISDQASAEFHDIGATFAEMALQITHDEAQTEIALHEKNVLLKEIHHRVKNNLQLIVSIINMQTRKLSGSEAKHALKRVQDRVLGLSMVHGNLYQSPSLSKIDAGKLLSDLVNQLFVVGAAPDAKMVLQTDIGKVELYPDQAVPFSLLATEAVTNALKYVGKPSSESAPWINVTLKANAQTGTVRLVVANSTGPKTAIPEDEISTGLGAQLIEAFVSQLDAEVELNTDDSAYTLQVSFTKQAFDSDA